MDIPIPKIRPTTNGLDYATAAQRENALQWRFPPYNITFPHPFLSPL